MVSSCCKQRIPTLRLANVSTLLPLLCYLATARTQNAISTRPLQNNSSDTHDSRYSGGTTDAQRINAVSTGETNLNEELG